MSNTHIGAPVEVAEPSCTHTWVFEATVRIGGSDPYFQYRCSQCQAHTLEFLRKRDAVNNAQVYSNTTD